MGLLDSAPLSALLTSRGCPAVCHGFVATISMLMIASCNEGHINTPGTWWPLMMMAIDVPLQPRCSSGCDAPPHGTQPHLGILGGIELHKLGRGGCVWHQVFEC